MGRFGQIRIYFGKSRGVLVKQRWRLILIKSESVLVVALYGGVLTFICIHFIKDVYIRPWFCELRFCFSIWRFKHKSNLNMTNYYIIIVFFELQEFKIVFQSWKVKESEKLYEEKFQNILPLWAKISTKFIKKNDLCMIFWKQIVLGLYKIYRNCKIEGDEQLCPLTYTNDLNSSNIIQILVVESIYKTFSEIGDYLIIVRGR